MCVKIESEFSRSFSRVRVGRDAPPPARASPARALPGEQTKRDVFGARNVYLCGGSSFFQDLSLFLSLSLKCLMMRFLSLSLESCVKLSLSYIRPPMPTCRRRGKPLPVGNRRPTTGTRFAILVGVRECLRPCRTRTIESVLESHGLCFVRWNSPKSFVGPATYRDTKET